MASFRLCMKEDFQNKNMSFSPTWAEAPLHKRRLSIVTLRRLFFLFEEFKILFKFVGKVLKFCGSICKSRCLFVEFSH